MAQSWFIMRGESRLGPFTHHGLVSLAANGGLAPYDMVWCTDLRAPIPATGVAGLFATVDAGFEPDPEPPAPPEPPPASVAVAPQPPRRETMLPPPRPRALTEPEEEDDHDNEFSFGRRRKDRFATLFQEQDLGDVSIDEDQEVEPEPEDDDDPLESGVPLVRRSTRRAAPARKRADHSGLLIALGGMAILAVIMLIVILEQGSGSPPSPTRPKKSPPSVTVSQPRPQPPQPEVAPRPEPPPPPKPRYDKEPLIAETAKASVDAIFQAAPSVKPRFRSLWESQLTDLLTQQTKGMREEEEIRAKVKEVSESWTRETRRFVDEQAAPAPQSPDAIDKATGEEPGADGGGEPNAAAEPAEPPAAEGEAAE